MHLIEQTKQELHKLLPDDLSLELFCATMWRHLDIGIALVGSDGEWVYINPKLEDIVGYTWQELKNISFQDITVEEDLYTDLNLVEDIKESRLEEYTLYKRYRHKLGHEVPIRLKVIPLGEGRGNLTLFLSQIVPSSSAATLNDEDAVIKEIRKISDRHESTKTCCGILITLVSILILLTVVGMVA